MPTENYTSKFRVDVSDLKKGISEANAAISKAKAEFKNATAGMDDYSKSADGLTAKIKEQQKVVEEERKKLDKLKEQLSRLNKSQEDGKKIISDLNNKYDEAVKKYGATSDEAKKYAKQLDEAEKAQERNRKAAEKLELQIIKEDTALKESESTIKKCNDQLKQLANEENEVGTAAQKTTEGGLSAFTVALGNLAANAITAVITKLGDLASATVDAFAEFDTGRDAVIKATGATGEAAKELEKSYATVAKAVPAELEDIGKALGEVSTRFEFTGDSLESATEQFLKFSDVTGADVITAIRNVSRAIESGGMDADEYATILDQLATAAQASGISADTLSERLTTYGAQMRALGYDTSDTISMLASWEKEGVNTETAITGIRKALSNWAKDGKDAKDELKSLIDEIKAAPDETTAAALALENFGNKAGTELADVIRSGRFEFAEFTDVIANSGGSVSATFDETQSGLDKISLATQSLKVTLGEIGGNIIGDLAPKISDVLTNLGDALTGDEDAAERFGDSIGGAITSIVTKITELLPRAISLVSTLITNIVTGIAENLSSDLIPNVITELSVAFTTILSTLGDILPDIIEKGLQLLPALNQALWNALPQVLTGLIQFITAIVDKLPDILEQALQTAPLVWEMIAQAIENNLPVLIEAVENLIKSVTKALPKILKILTKELPKLIKTGMGILKDVYPIVVQAAIDLLGALIDALPELIMAWNEAAPDLVKAIGAALVDCAPLLWETAKQVWSIILEQLPNLLTSLVEGLYSILKSALLAWKKILSPVTSWIYDNIITPVGDFFSNMWDNFKEKAGKAWDGVKSIFGKVADFFGEKFGAAWQKVKDIFSTGGRVFDGIKEGIEAAFTSTVNAIIRGINRVVSIPFTNLNEVLDKLRDIEILGMNPFSNIIGDIAIPSIPELAKGGIVNGRSFIAGEAGAEAIIPLENNTAGLRKIAALLANEMGVQKTENITYNFTQTNNSPKALSRYEIYRQTRNLVNAVKGV